MTLARHGGTVAHLARRSVHVGAACLLLAATAACAEEEPETAPSEPCIAAVDEAAMATEIDEQVDLLDRALIVCRSVEALDRALSAHPSAIGLTPVDFATRRCNDPPDGRVGASTICRSVVTTTTSTTVAEVTGELVYTGRTLDGRDVEIRSSQTVFTEGRPASIVQIVDIATEDGCEGVQEEFERWLLLVEDPEVGDEASVYAQHALNVLAARGCD